MNLSTLRPAPGSRKNRKRLGRGIGSGQGKTAGRGQKGQGARSGGNVPAGFEGGQMPIQRRVPKSGFTNPSRERYQTVSLADLERFEAGATVDADALRAARLVRRPGPVKVLSDGELSKALTVRVDAASARAREKIEAAGGTVEARPR